MELHYRILILCVQVRFESIYCQILVYNLYFCVFGVVLVFF